MVESSDVGRQADIAATVADYFFTNGNVRASLRDIADDVGTSARMLLHYFATREELVAAALEILRVRQVTAAEKAVSPFLDVETMLHNVWRWFQRDDTRRYFAVFNDVAALERLAPEVDRKFMARMSSEWRPMFETAFAADSRYEKQATEMAQLLIATLRGFALDVHSPSQAKGQKAAYFAFVDLIVDRQ